VGTIACAATIAACSGEEAATREPAAKDGTIRLEVRADADGNLRLEGSIANAKYVGIYPNPDRWSSIELVIDATGIPRTRCTRDGVVSTCTETPFFVELAAVRVPAATTNLGIRSGGAPSEPSSGDGASGDSTSSDAAAPSAPAPTAPSEPAASGDGGVKVTVTDVDGEKVAETTIPPPSGSPAPAPAGSTCGGAATGGSPGQGGFAKNGETQACAAASLADTPGCDGTTVAAAAKVYCDAVNAQLPAEDKIDCSVLTNPAYVPSALPDTRSGGDCSTYWEPARAAVEAYKSCAKVDLLLTQWRDRSRHELISNGVCRSSPLMLDLDGDGIHATSLAEGVSFDLLGTGEKVRSAWSDGKDAFLALDRNANGAIDGAAELFGNASGGGTHEDGFAALAELDDNGDGAIDAKDRAFGHLVVWRDADRNGVSAPGELSTLRDAGIRRLSLHAVRTSGPSSLDVHGNAIPLVASFERDGGKTGMLVDVFFRFKPIR
jgi:hypothetical protein